jgi:chromosome segregation ATPase
MVKKGILGAALGAGALALLFGTSAPSYIKTAFCKVRQTAKGSVPIQFEIDRARQEVIDLEPAIHQNLENLTRAEVEVEQLEAEIHTMTANLDRESKSIVALRNVLAGELKLTGNVNYSPEEVKADLAARFDHYGEMKRILANKRETLKLRKKAVTAANDQLNKMKAAKLTLMTKIESIETKLKQIEATQAANDFNFDDSALARAKATVAELDKRLEVMARMAEREGRYTEHGIVLPIDATRDIVKEVDAEFSKTSSDRTDKNL